VTTFLLIRHGLTDAVDHHLAGRAAGMHLNEAGRQQAVRLATVMQSVALTAVVSSPLDRARETAGPIAALHGLDVEIVEALTEHDPGAWTGIPLGQLAADDAFRRFNHLRSLTRPPRGELMLQVQTRAIGALLDLHERFPAGVVGVVSHGDVIRAALLLVLGMPIDFVHRLHIEPARVSIVDFTNGAPTVRLVNGGTSAGVW
jgi:probable phosphoglycerate mutase